MSGLGPSPRKRPRITAATSQGGLEALGWQATCMTLHERMAHLLMSEERADVHFLFSEANADGGTTQQVWTNIYFFVFNTIIAYSFRRLSPFPA